MRRVLAPFLGGAAQRDDAWERAEGLLRASLTSEQLAGYAKRGYVEIASRLRPGRVYRVDGWRPVTVFEDGRFVGAVCIRPREPLPGPDVVLARKLLIEGAETEFLRAGNWLSPAWRPASAVPSLVLLLVLLAPWLLPLLRFGFVGVAAATGLALAPCLYAIRRRRVSRETGANAQS